MTRHVLTALQHDALAGMMMVISSTTLASFSNYWGGEGAQLLIRSTSSSRSAHARTAGRTRCEAVFLVRTRVNPPPPTTTTTHNTTNAPFPNFGVGRQSTGWEWVVVVGWQACRMWMDLATD
jgi:hypothetical protein